MNQIDEFTEKYPYAGQNVYQQPQPPEYPYIKSIEDAILAWYGDEYQNGKLYGYMEFIKAWKRAPNYTL